MIFIIRKKVLINSLISVINIFLIVSLKPYIIVALLPGVFMWAFFNSSQKIDNKIVRMMAGPGIIVMGLTLGLLTLSLFGENLGSYTNFDSISKKAQLTQQDLVRGEQYGQNYYDIGKFEATPVGMLKKAPISIATALFRPFLWEARNPVMILSGLENLIIIIAAMFILFKVGLFRTIRIVINEPLLFFSLLFAIMFAFSVGIASANFGAMVRYRIPCMIFFIPSLFILYERLKEMKKVKLESAN